MAVVVVASSVTLGAAPADAAPKGPTRIDLGVGFRPEGITTLPGGSAFFAGSMADGRIVKGNLRTGEVWTLVGPEAGRAVRGMMYDARSGLVWATGTAAGGGFVLVFNASSGAVVKSWTIPDAAFLNDLTVTPSAVWVTDSGVDRLIRIPVLAGGVPGDTLSFLPLSGAWPTSGDLRANGIRALPDGTLLLDQSSAGGLWRVDPSSGVVSRIPISRGSLIGGDGVELMGSTVFVVRGNDNESITRLTLGHSRGGQLTARWRGRITDPGIDFPSTTSRSARYLYTISARFSVADPTSADFWVTRTSARR